MSVLTEGSFRLLKNKYRPSFEMKGSMASPVYPMIATCVGFENAGYAAVDVVGATPDDWPQPANASHINKMLIHAVKNDLCSRRLTGCCAVVP